MIGYLKDYATKLENIGDQPELSRILSELITSSSRGATKVVAASDSLESSKQAADYICDGVDDQVQIHAAIDALPSNGGVVVLLEGTFNFTGVGWTADILTITKSNVIIEGQGKATHIKVVGDEGRDVIYFNSVQNCVIRDVWVDGNGLGGYAIRFRNSSECKVLNCIVGNTWGDGIVGSNLSYSLIKGNIVYDCQTNAHGDVSSGIELEDGCNHINVEDNCLSDCGSGIWTKRHLGYPLTHDISIVRNTLYNSRITLSSEDTDPIENINVIGNTLSGATTCKAISLSNVINSTIRDNTLHSPVHDYGGIYLPASVTHILVDGNRIYSASTAGIFGHGDKCIISNNYIVNSGGMGITGFNSGGVISGNRVANSGARGIYVGAPQISVIGNIVKNSAQEGIRVHNTHDDVISNNICFDDQGAKTQTYGITISEFDGDCDNITVIGNNVVGNKDGGISIGANTNENGIVRDNLGYVTKKSATSTGTGAQQTIAHGLAAAPTKIILWNIEDGANPYQSASADATNIYITAVVNQDWGWQAEVE